MKKNNINSVSRSHNTSGLNECGYHKATDSWQSRITFEGHRYHVGVFDTPEESAAARIGALTILAKLKEQDTA